MLYPNILLCFLASSSNYLMSSGDENVPEDQKHHSSVSISSTSNSPGSTGGGGGRRSKSMDLDEWYYWQSRKWANRHRRPYPAINNNYEQYYSTYPLPQQSYYYPPQRSYKAPPSRRNGISLTAPLTAPSSNSYSTTDTDGIQGVFAKWNPKINLTWPPSIAVSSTNDYPDYSPSSSYHHHHEDDHHYRQIQFIPIHMPCNHDHHGHGKKKEISLIWPLLFLGLLFLPLLFGALFLPLAFLFITNIIQLLNLLQRIQQPAAAATGGKRRKKRTINHPIDEQISLVADRLEKSLVKFFFLFSKDSNNIKSKIQGKPKTITSKCK